MLPASTGRRVASSPPTVPTDAADRNLRATSLMSPADPSVEAWRFGALPGQWPPTEEVIDRAQSSRRASGMSIVVGAWPGQ